MADVIRKNGRRRPCVFDSSIHQSVCNFKLNSNLHEIFTENLELVWKKPSASFMALS